MMYFRILHICITVSCSDTFLIEPNLLTFALNFITNYIMFCAMGNQCVLFYGFVQQNCVLVEINAPRVMSVVLVL